VPGAGCGASPHPCQPPRRARPPPHRPRCVPRCASIHHPPPPCRRAGAAVGVPRRRLPPRHPGPLPRHGPAQHPAPPHLPSFAPPTPFERLLAGRTAVCTCSSKIGFDMPNRTRKYIQVQVSMYAHTIMPQKGRILTFIAILKICFVNMNLGSPQFPSIFYAPFYESRSPPQSKRRVSGGACQPTGRSVNRVPPPPRPAARCRAAAKAPIPSLGPSAEALRHRVPLLPRRGDLSDSADWVRFCYRNIDPPTGGGGHRHQVQASTWQSRDIEVFMIVFFLLINLLIIN